MAIFMEALFGSEALLPFDLSSGATPQPGPLFPGARLWRDCGRTAAGGAAHRNHRLKMIFTGTFGVLER
jgi:hypothetical protein